MMMESLLERFYREIDITNIKDNKKIVYSSLTGYFIINKMSDINEQRIYDEVGNFNYLLDECNQIIISKKEEIEEYYNCNINKSRYYFTADLHIGHKGILKHQPDRGFTPETIDEHDEWIINMWNNTLEKKDVIYINGDFIWKGTKEAERILHKLKGTKHFIIGNHDASTPKLPNFFETIGDTKVVLFKKTIFPFLEEDFTVFLSHYPHVSWNHKSRNSCMLHGHTHNKCDLFNNQSTDLRFDVGIDSELGYHHFPSLSEVYIKYLEKKILTNKLIINL